MRDEKRLFVRFAAEAVFLGGSHAFCYCEGWGQELAVCTLRGKGACGPRRNCRYLQCVWYGNFWLLIFDSGAVGVPRLRARPKGTALWIPAAFEKAGETFFLRFARFSLWRFG